MSTQHPPGTHAALCFRLPCVQAARTSWLAHTAATCECVCVWNGGRLGAVGRGAVGPLRSLNRRACEERQQRPSACSSRSFLAHHFSPRSYGIDLSVNMILTALERAAAAGNGDKARPASLCSVLGRRWLCAGQHAQPARVCVFPSTPAAPPSPSPSPSLPLSCLLPQVSFEVSDAAKRAFPPDSFDVIISRDTLLHIEDKPAVFARRVPPAYRLRTACVPCPGLPCVLCSAQAPLPAPACPWPRAPQAGRALDSRPLTPTPTRLAAHPPTPPALLCAGCLTCCGPAAACC